MLTHGRRVAARLGDMEKGTWTVIPSLCRVNCLFYKQLSEHGEGWREATG